MSCGSAAEKSTGEDLGVFMQSTTLGVGTRGRRSGSSPGWKNEPKNTRLPSANGVISPSPLDVGSFVSPHERQWAWPPWRFVIHSAAVAPWPVLPPGVPEAVEKNSRRCPSCVNTGHPADVTVLGRLMRWIPIG